MSSFTTKYELNTFSSNHSSCKPSIWYSKVGWHSHTSVWYLVSSTVNISCKILSRISVRKYEVCYFLPRLAIVLYQTFCKRLYSIICLLMCFRKSSSSFWLEFFVMVNLHTLQPFLANFVNRNFIYLQVIKRWFVE